MDAKHQTLHNNQLHSNAFEKAHFYQVCECIEHGEGGTLRASLRYKQQKLTATPKIRMKCLNEKIPFFYCFE